MDIYVSCPKCGAEGLEPTWHMGCVPIDSEISKIKTKGGSKTKGNKFVNTSEAEHLHYFCKCGYDFCRPIKKKEK